MPDLHRFFPCARSRLRAKDGAGAHCASQVSLRHPHRDLLLRALKERIISFGEKWSAFCIVWLCFLLLRQENPDVFIRQQ